MAQVAALNPGDSQKDCLEDQDNGCHHGQHLVEEDVMQPKDQLLAGKEAKKGPAIWISSYFCTSLHLLAPASTCTCPPVSSIRAISVLFHTSSFSPASSRLDLPLNSQRTNRMI